MTSRPRPLSPRVLLATAAVAASILAAACGDDPASPKLALSDSASFARSARTTAPGTPTNVSATPGNGNATVRWTAPASNGGSAITGYKIVQTPGGHTIPAGATATSVVVPALTNGTAYTFTVAATNAGGTGVASASTAPVTPTAGGTVPPAGARWVLGYYVGYQRSQYPETAVDFTKLTHIIVGPIHPRTDGTVGVDFDIDEVNGPAMARTLSSRAHAASRRALLMLGGAGEHGGFVGAASSTNRTKFVTNLLATMDNLGYDGIDVDWEPIDAPDRANYLALLQALRTARPAMILTTPLGWVNANFPSSIDSWYGQVASVVDRVNLMTYEMAGPWDGWVTWHHSALSDAQGNHPSSIASSVDAYLAAGVPASKLGIGLGFYGSCWRGATAPRQTVGAGVSLVGDDNSMSYATIMSQYYVAANRVWDSAAQASYLSFPTARGPLGCNFISYEDAQSVAAKGAYVKSRGLGGAIVWTIGEGHLSSAPAGQQDPLLSAAYTSIVQ